jgi:hypothetical protein
MRELLREQSNYVTNVVATSAQLHFEQSRLNLCYKFINDGNEHFIDRCTSTIMERKKHSIAGSKTQNS